MDISVTSQVNNYVQF